MVQTLYSLIDIYWVGRLGKDAVAAVAVASNLMFVVISSADGAAVDLSAVARTSSPISLARGT